MRDIFSEGLLYLDLLEIYGSTYAVAEICGIAQSNVFRGANACSKLLNLGLAKDRQSGRYRVEHNLDVQRDLRKLNQRMRARENGRLRVVGAEVLVSNNPIALEQARTYQLLPNRWRDDTLSLEYLERSLLDVVLVKASQVASRLSWPPPVRRTDLFVPVGQFAITELTDWPLLLAASSDHPLVQAPSLRQACALEWFVDADIPLDLVRESYPSVSLNSLSADAPTDELIPPQLPSDGRWLWLTDQRRFAERCLQDPSGSLYALQLDIGLVDHLLAITLLPLIREPMHQSLIGFLRELSVNSVQQPAGAGYVKPHGCL
jgi:hypothetical protein